MNRNIYYLLFILLFSTSMFAAETSEPYGAHPWNKELNANGVNPWHAHWTLALDAGFNIFDGDFNSEMKHPVGAPALGLALEYNFTPMWFLGGEFWYDWYRVAGKDGHAETLLDGHMLRGQVYLGFDLMSACYPLTTQKIFALDLLVGGGVGGFKRNIYYPDATRGHTATSEALKDDKFSSAYPFITGGALFDFNLGRVTSLGLKVAYNYFIKDEVDGRGQAAVASKNNDGLLDITLNLRFKFVSKKKTHVRNIASYRAMEELNGDKDRLRDTLVVLHVDTIFMISEPQIATAAVQTVRDEDYYYIYFEHDRSTFDDRALIDIQKLANRLQREPDLCVEIIGYCDNTGSEEYNEGLGMARAKNIRDELVEEYHIDVDRILFSGGGVIKGGRSTGAYTPNRRADVHIMNCVEMDEVRQAYAERQAAEENARKEAMAERVNGVVVAPEGLTLSGIARKYYGNAYCWVYLYEVNRKKLNNNPNYIPAGALLYIPDLTESQRNISKRKADAYYEKLKAKQ